MSSKPSRQLGDILSGMPRATATPRGEAEDTGAVGVLEVASEAGKAPPAAAAAPAAERGEAEVPLQVTVPKHIRKRLLVMATEQDRSMRALILTAIRSLGVEVAEEELRDKRRRT